MQLEDVFKTVCVGICFFSWLGAYLLALCRGYIDKTYAIPLPAIMANVVWELIYGTVFRNQSPCGPYLPVLWLAVDVIILAQALWYWRREFSATSKLAFSFIFASGMITCFGILYYAQVEGVHYIASAFPQDLMMAILFIQMLIVRNDVRGQSMYIGLLQMLGNASIIWVAADPITELSKLNAVTFIAILFFNFLYLVLLHRKLCRFGFSPWRRL